ncbi:SUKH-4 family immunity protein [Streptomyces daliensis]
MVTFAQAQERAERWVNEDVPGYQHREVRVREFDHGFVAWAEDREDGPTSDGGRTRLVIARDSGDVTLWPGLSVGEVIRRYEEEYGAPPAPPEPGGVFAQRVDLEATSFLLTPPEWLQEAADQRGIPNRRSGADQGASASAGSGSASGSGSGESAGAGSASVPSAAASPWDAADTSSSGNGIAQQPPATVFAPPITGSDDDDTPPPPPSSRSEAKTELIPEGSVLPPRTTVAPALDEPDESGTQTPPGGQGQGDGGGQGGPGGVHHAATMLANPSQGGPGGIGAPPPPPGPPGAGAGAGDIADADTSRAPRGSVPSPPRPSRGGGPSVPPPPGAPGTPGARPGAGAGPGAPGSPGAGYVPTQMVSADDLAAQISESGQVPAVDGPQGQGQGDGGGQGGPGGVHHAATMLANPSQGGPGGIGAPPPPPSAPPGGQGDGGGQGGSGGVHHAATMLANPSQGGPGGPGAIGSPPPPPGPPGAPPTAPPPPPSPPNTPPPAYGFPQGPPPGTPGPVPPGPVPPGPGGPPPAYGYPQQPPTGQPTVGPGYMAVLRYRAPDGSEQQLIRRSAPGTPHPEWQILHELRAMNVPPQQVLELHTELESCDLPGGYCARMIRETWPQVRISNTAPYGLDHASRQQGMRHLLEHQGELHQVADGPARPAPNRVPMPPPQHIQPAPPIPPDGIGMELQQAFGPQGVFRFEQRAVSRQGVPDIVGQTLVWAGLPVDFGPFFWGQAQPGRPVPTLAELAQERGVQPGADAGSYLVMGNDFGRQLCVQYGTAHIVAVPLEGAPGGQPAPAQFVNTGLPEFVRCMALLGRMWRLRYGLTQEQAGRWTVDFQMQLAALDPAALSSPENWWSVLLEQMWDGLF